MRTETLIDRYRKALERIADPTEMAGMGDTEDMTGPAKCELDCRMNTAREALGKPRLVRPKEESA